MWEWPTALLVTWGHFGRKRFTNRLLTYWSPKLHLDIVQISSTCWVCPLVWIPPKEVSMSTMRPCFGTQHGDGCHPPNICWIRQNLQVPDICPIISRTVCSNAFRCSTRFDSVWTWWKSMRRKLDKDMTRFCEADLILDGTLNRNFHHCTSYQASAYIFQSQRKMCKIPYAKIQCRSSREV